LVGLLNYTTQSRILVVHNRRTKPFAGNFSLWESWL